MNVAKLLILSIAASGADAISTFWGFLHFGNSLELNPFERGIFYLHFGNYAPLAWWPIESLVVFATALVCYFSSLLFMTWLDRAKKPLWGKFAMYGALAIAIFPFLVSMLNMYFITSLLL